MKQQSLADYPEYQRVHAAVQKLKEEEQNVIARMGEIEIELTKPKQQLDGQAAWEATLENRDTPRYEIDSNSSAREEYALLEGRLTFIRQALEIGIMALDKVVGGCSLEICQGIRKEWVVHVGRILQNLKAIAEANRTLDAMRNDLEREGIKTGSLAHCTYDLGGEWGSQFGGRLIGFQRFIAENYPELTEVAGMSIKAKLAALSKREEQLQEGATE